MQSDEDELSAEDRCPFNRLKNSYDEEEEED
jgi:hypothetical protein